jgi:hypothetical protein
MLRRQIINITRRYNHQHCEKNFPQVNYNNFFENNDKKLDLIQKQLQENNNSINNVQDCINLLFTFNVFTTIVLLIKSV